MEKEIAKRVLGVPDVVRKMIEAMEGDDPGTLTLTHTDSQPQEQLIAQYDGKSRLETGEFTAYVYAAENGNMYVTAFADSNLHFHNQELLQLAARFARSSCDTIEKCCDMHFLTVSEYVVEHFCVQEPIKKGKNIGFWNVGLKRMIYTASTSRDIGELLEIVNGKPIQALTELGQAAKEICGGVIYVRFENPLRAEYP